MKRRTGVILAVVCILFAASVAASSGAEYFDTSALGKGMIKVACTADTRLKVQIQGGGSTTYTYDLNNTGKKESFPLQMGNGDYKITLYQQTSNGKYKVLATEKVTLNLSDPNAVYLNSVQSIEWSVNPQSVAKAVELTKDEPDLEKKANILWNYMAKNNQYDYNKLASLPSTYLPVPDSTLAVRSGICYDFSSLYAAMLRSEGIPAKLVKGYAPDYAVGYHAWNEVYDAAKKQWIVVDPTYDLQAYANSKPLTMIKQTDKYKKESQY